MWRSVIFDIIATVILHDTHHFLPDILDALKRVPPIPTSLSTPHPRDIRAIHLPRVHSEQFLSILLCLPKEAYHLSGRPQNLFDIVLFTTHLGKTSQRRTKSPLHE